MVPRLLMMGMCAAVVVLLATFEPLRIQVVRPMVLPPDPSALTVLDVAHGVAANQLAAMVRLGPGEWLSAINDRPLANEFAADEVITELAPRPGDYLDLTVSGDASDRRVLVLLH